MRSVSSVRAAVLAALAALIAGALQVPAAGADDALLVGRVTDLARVGIAGVCVTATDAFTLELRWPGVVTDADGDYEVYLPATPHYLHFTDCERRATSPDTAPAPRWYPDARRRTEATPVALQPGENRVDMALPPGGTITGELRGPDGSPVAGSAMAVPVEPGIGSALARVGDDGTFTISGLASGDYRVVGVPAPATDLAYEYYVDAYDRESATPVPVAEGLTSPIAPTRLRRKGVVTGRVQGSDGRPVREPCIEFNPLGNDPLGYSWSARGAPDGTFEITDVQPGRYLVKVEPCGAPYEPGWYGGPTPEDAIPITVEPEETVSGVDVTLRAVGVISGRVVGEDGSPVAGACLTASTAPDADTGEARPAVTAKADAEGRYRLVVLPGGYRVRATDCAGSRWAPMYWPAAATALLGRTVTATDGTDRAGTDFRLPRGGRIAGTVTDDKGTPLPGMCAGAFPVPDGSEPVGGSAGDASGRYTTGLLPPGRYAVNFHPCPAARIHGEWWKDAPYQSVATLVDVVAGRTTPGVNGTLTRFRLPSAPRQVTAVAGDGAARVRWTAPVDAGSRPIAQYRIVATPGGRTISVGSIARSAVIPGLSNGASHTFTVHAVNFVGTSAGGTSGAVTPSAGRVLPPEVDPVPAVNAGATVTLTGSAMPFTTFRLSATHAGGRTAPDGVSITVGSTGYFAHGLRPRHTTTIRPTANGVTGPARTVVVRQVVTLDRVATASGCRVSVSGKVNPYLGGQYVSIRAERSDGTRVAVGSARTYPVTGGSGTYATTVTLPCGRTFRLYAFADGKDGTARVWNAGTTSRLVAVAVT